MSASADPVAKGACWWAGKVAPLAGDAVFSGMAKLMALTDANAVRSAITEFRALGRNAFLRKYGYGKAERFFLLVNGEYFDSKAIVGVAYGYQYPKEGALPHNTFSGGLGGAARALRQLEFRVVEGAPRYLVLAQNEISADPEYAWKDVTGERYHFPNSYRNRIRPGSHFIYYRGSRRVTGRAEPDYFGYGRIGDTYPDPDTVDLPQAKQAWYADIADFHQFPKPVSFRSPGGVFRETGTEKVANNYWGTGVREIEAAQFLEILSYGGVSPTAFEVDAKPLDFRPEVTPTISQTLLIPRALKAPSASPGSGATRRSPRAKEIGDLAERLVCEWLRSSLPPQEADKIVWVANLGETPGYDIEDRRTPGKEVGYEVKATAGPRFPAFEMTANELRAAKAMGDRYVLVLVANIETSTPLLQPIPNPAQLFEKGELIAQPSAFLVSRLA